MRIIGQLMLPRAGELYGDDWQSLRVTEGTEGTVEGREGRDTHTLNDRRVCQATAHA
ncbi:MAG: hypothetical protein Tsb0027_01450 [Wenzhouxiangellaceae bacterium]